ncbi:MAG: hypothetical protein HMLKMBBP_01422 [Planctomycetes bacterium]|nr:hypothetical protein [Planctomycetota bacterium]
MTEEVRADVVVIGGGPAGATLAARLAQLGHDVCLVERDGFPRRHVGESLTPGVLPLLEASGARAAVEAAGFPAAPRVDVEWTSSPVRRDAPSGDGGLLVDRGRFDALLLDHARSCGVRVLQPAAARAPAPAPTRADCGWRVAADHAGGRTEISARFVAFAGGRSSPTSVAPLREGAPTVALFAYWRGARLPDAPRIEAAEHGWRWGVPIPDGTYNTLVFADRDAAPRGTSPEDRFRALMSGSRLFEGCEGLVQDGPVRASDATPRLAGDPVSTHHIRVGDAALALDPLASSGVQRAIQSAVSGAVVVNTLLRRPERSGLAESFHRSALLSAYDRHAAWAGSHYAAAGRTGPFWTARAATAPLEEPHRVPVDWSSHAELAVSSECSFPEIPCLDADFVSSRAAVSHPALDEPVAFLAGHELAPLLRSVRGDAAPLALAQQWASRMPSRAAFALVEWLAGRGLLVAGANRSAATAASARLGP